MCVVNPYGNDGTAVQLVECMMTFLIAPAPPSPCASSTICCTLFPLLYHSDVQQIAHRDAV